MDDEIAWYENNGNEGFTRQLITTSADGAADVFAIDVDSDGDIDVISASSRDNKIAWYENNGNEAFTPHTITTSLEWPTSVFAIDLDKDGDIDVLSSSDYTVAWYENNGNEVFTKHTITTSKKWPEAVFAIDLDQDGDIDVLSANSDDNTVTWYENNGNEVFSAHDITTSADFAADVFAIDLDSDGDIDVLSVSIKDDKIAWYENNGNEAFTPHTITTSANGVRSVFAIDLDKDNDIDVLSANFYDNKVAWYENNGNEVFSAHTITTSANEVNDVFAIDLDSDGDIDVLSASWISNKIEWYENTMPTSDCNNGIRDGIETGADCGGDCSIQDCCTNGYRDINLGEGGVDCGGYCQSCISCDNRIQDGSETGVDCGGSCSEPCYRLKILAVPLRWGGSQQGFDNAVDTQLDFFIDSTQLNSCREKVKVDKLDVDEDNFVDFSCSSRDCGVQNIKPFVESLGISVKDYDHIVAFTQSSPCNPIQGCSNGKDAAWVTTTYDIVGAHEIGHFYGLEDEYCSNQAGSNDFRCNDGGDLWWWGPIPIPSLDKNYLGTDLGCDPDIGDCCEDCSSSANIFGNGDYFICCEGNTNSKGGIAIMSYANAPGPREFDDRSKAHLNTFPKLKCTGPLMATIGIQALIENKIIDLDLLISNNDSVEKRWLNLADGTQSVSTNGGGSYSLLAKDIGNNVLFNYTFEAFFDYSGPMVKNTNYNSVNLDTYDLSLKIGYDDEMYKIELQHNQNIIFSEILNFCNNDGICSGSETYLSCWQDCESWAKDSLCINNLDGHCDPDCAQGIDTDCKLNLTLNLIKGWNLISIPLNLTNNTLPEPLQSIQGNYSKIFTYLNGKWLELKNNDKISGTIGFWINMTNNDTLFIEGYSLVNITFDLNLGWNLIGYPYIQQKIIPTLFDNKTVYMYNNSEWQSYNPDKSSNTLTKFTPGYGYWVKKY